MKAVLCKAFGPPESLVLEQVTPPVPARNEVLVNVHSSALNFPDVLMLEGKYQSQPPFPFSPGGEISGTIVATGEEVSGFQVGDAVFASVGYGGFAEQITVNEQALRVKPERMSFEQAAGISTTYGTSYYALKQRASLQPDENLLVLGAGGGVGISAVELGKVLGARVIAAASSTEKLQAAKKAGADELIDYSDGELKDKVKELTGGKGADVIYDPVGGALFDQCMRCINWYGRVLVIGFAAGDIPRLPTNLVLLKSCQVVGVYYGAWSARSVDESSANFKEILELFEQGKIDPLVGKVYPLEQYADALRCLSERQAIGKVVVNIQ
ncbi:MAG: NADPH:quinone oxidoreductase family protein [Gammaproteobacteria bacterium]|nr:NADPH:quinone oxidoreductase family protein [Gammaproteobacteria bacterium]